ncbi:MAG: YhfC family glutamic-type intramembrane protease [Syntrophaceticus sp.]|nr:YhfC family glutamic-type intramembrane protease [Syntrophaceticus sp.]MDD3314219.1 YhfC family glutamic-type intramembrane protease [Syntrophaceticus sp.]MDD4360001.1 YhfC family glutamic-type intramembrane protease [Syntrophaceticus sp.]MDD4783252.1 YhfC family glutamic-type intramembrane protease [Syntrophaceticus sp.]
MRGKKILYFVLGFLCFIIAQPLLRFPLLEWLNQNPDFTLAYMMNPPLIGVLIALSAGIFEETFRFLFKLLLMKPDRCAISQPILFGLGHGIAEACVVLLPAVSIFSISSLALLERLLAVIFHVTVTIVVWNGFQGNKKVLYLLLAILLHGMMDALIPIISSFTTSLIIFEGAFLIVDIFMVIYAFHSRKYYLKEENQ